MDEVINIGIVGCGRVAENHIRAISVCKKARLAAVAGGRKASQFASLYNVPLLNKEEITSSPLIDALLVLTPYAYHFHYADSALRHGKHVLVEKPVSFDREEIQKLKETAKNTGCVCMPGHSYIYLPEIRRICSSVQQQKIGYLTYFHFAEVYYMPPGLFEKYEGPEIDVLGHQLYLSLAIAGIPEQISVFTNSFSKTNIETGGPQVSVNLKYTGGALGQIILSWAGEDVTSDPWTFNMKILGTGGGLTFSRRSYSVILEDKSIDQPQYQEMFDEQMRYFIDKCIFSKTPPLSTIHDALLVCRLHNMIIESIRTGGIIRVTQEE